MGQTLFTALTLCVAVKLAAGQVLTFCDLARDGRECSITCNSTGLTETVIFYKDNIRKASCDVVPGLPSAVCVVTVSDRYSIEQSGNTSQTILHIKKVSRVHDTGEWSCSVGKRDGQSKLLQIYDMDDNSTSTVFAIKREENESLSVNFTTQCIFPKPNITLSCLNKTSSCQEMRVYNPIDLDGCSDFRLMRYRVSCLFSEECKAPGKQTYDIDAQVKVYRKIVQRFSRSFNIKEEGSKEERHDDDRNVAVTSTITAMTVAGTILCALIYG